MCCLMMEIPFYGSMKAYHHLMSDLAWIFMWITEQCFFFASLSNDINWPMKDRPGFPHCMHSLSDLMMILAVLSSKLS